MVFFQSDFANLTDTGACQNQWLVQKQFVIQYMYDTEKHSVKSKQTARISCSLTVRKHSGYEA